MINIQLLFIVLAVSFDSFMIGLSFGMKKINVPIRAYIVIFLLSCTVVLTAMQMGDLFGLFLPEKWTDVIGSFIFISLGLLLLRSNHRSTSEATFDKDQSKHISLKEAFFLGMFLTMDAFGAGFGAAFLAFSPIFLASMIAFATVLLLFGGITLGKISTKNKTIASLSYLPPFLLMSIGLYHLLTTLFE